MIRCLASKRTSASQTSISIIVVSLNEGKQLRRTVDNLQSVLPPGGELIVVDDGSTDGSTGFLRKKSSAYRGVRLVRSGKAGLSKARNYGARQAMGEIVVFADAHIQVSPVEWWRPVEKLLANPKIGAVGPAVSAMGEPECVGYGQVLAGPDLLIEWNEHHQDVPHPVCLLGGCFLAMRAKLFRELGGFDEGMIRWGSEDAELCIRLWLMGYQVWVAPSVDVAHLFREKFPYEVDWTQVIHNKLRTAFVHFDRTRMERVVDALRDSEGFAEALALLVESDFAARRAQLMAARKHDDDWLFARFGFRW
jgi:glycosyltransferase involved in cell wall biosynthesis